MDPTNEAVEAALGLVRHLPTEEIKLLMNDDSRLQNMIADLPQGTRLAQEQEMLLVSNKSLAEHNMTLEPKLTEGKQSLISSYEEASRLADALTELKASTDSSSGQYKPDTIQALLQTAAHELEEKTEKIVQGFLDKEMEVEDFIAEFIPERTVAHTRRIKAEKVAEMIRKGNIGGVPANNSVSSPSYAPPTSYPLPYPTNYNMPMPGF